MFTELLIALFLGIMAGIITGLIPGIHINLISVTVISLSPFLLHYTNPLLLSLFILSMSVVHTFLDVIPSIFLGAPDPAQALGVLPGHRFMLKGQGLFAVKLTILGSYGALLVSFLLFPLFLFIVQHGYSYLSPLIPYLIILIVLFMILRDRKKLWAVTIFICSGILGLLVLHHPTLNQPLFPLLSGLFGVSTLLYSLKEHHSFPKQLEKDHTIPKTLFCKALTSGCFSGFITAVMPGLGSGMAAVISSQITRKLGDAGFMVLLGSISTFNFLLSLVTFYSLEKARNGSIVALQQLLSSLSFEVLLLFLVSFLIVGSFAVFLTLFFSKLFLRLVLAIFYTRLVLSIVLFIVVLTGLLSGPVGLLVLIVSTAVGFLPAIKKTTRTMGMGCLIVPILGYFFGF